MKILKSKTIYFMLFILALAFHANAEIKIFEIKSLKDANVTNTFGVADKLRRILVDWKHRITA